MEHAGKASRAALRLIYWTLVGLLALMFAGVLARLLGGFLVHFAGALAGLWVVFAVFCLYFFRDPEPRIPTAKEAIVAPAHGTVDYVGEIDEPDFMGGRCQRISIFLSVFDVHIQRAPVSGRITLLRYTAGQFLNAMAADSARYNENVLVGIESDERPGERIGLRLIAGLIARRIIPWIAKDDAVQRGMRISLIQFGSRCDLYLPIAYKVAVAPGAKVRGGETVIARRS